MEAERRITGRFIACKDLTRSDDDYCSYEKMSESDSHLLYRLAFNLFGHTGGYSELYAAVIFDDGSFDVRLAVTNVFAHDDKLPVAEFGIVARESRIACWKMFQKYLVKKAGL